MNSTTLFSLLFVFFAVSQALQFEVLKTKCLKEELAYDVLVKGKYTGQSSPISIVNMFVSKLKYTISNHSNNSLYIQITDVNDNVIFKDVDGSGSFAFTTTAAGMYSFCFETVPTGSF